MIVRFAQMDDLEQLLILGERMRQESIVPYPEINSVMVREFLKISTQGSGQGYAFAALVAEEDGELVGFMAAFCGPPIFSTEPAAHHSIFYVTPERRGSFAAKKLISAYEQWAEDQGAVAAEICVDTGLFTERTGKFYERLGYQFMGGKYRKSWQQQAQ